MVNSDYAFNPDQQYAAKPQSGRDSSPPAASSRKSTMLDSQQGFFDDFAGQQQPEAYGGPNRYSQGDGFSPTAAVPPPLFGGVLASLTLTC